MSLQADLDKLSSSDFDEVGHLYLKGEEYTYRAFGSKGYWVYKTKGKFDDEAYFVSEFKCTCGGFTALGQCKHYSGLRHLFK